MSLWSRIANVFRGDRLNREIAEELELHVEEAIAQGRDPVEARRALGAALRHREESRDIRLIPWLDALRADAGFGWRQLNKSRVPSGAVILSLALALGACTSAFQIIDALLLRSLPVAEPERLYVLSRQFIGDDGTPRTSDSCAYPMFRQMRAAVKAQGELIAISYGVRVNLTYSTNEESEKAYRQYVSGWMFNALGIQPAWGRLFTESDDLTPGAHPYAVLSYDYWTRRFGQDRQVIGRTFRMDDKVYEIVGVAQKGFVGVEPGKAIDIYVPTMMNASVIHRPDSNWFRTFIQLKAGVDAKQMGDRLRPILRSFLEERMKTLTAMPKESLGQFLDQTLSVESAATGVSRMQRDYRLPLGALGVLAGLVLIVACANVANLMTARAAARAREMALRVAIGARRWRLVQLVLMESAWLAFLAAGLGVLIAWWVSPFVVSKVNPPEDPVRLLLGLDWRVLGFCLALTFLVTCLIGLAPALRASAVKPSSALKGGDDPHARRRLMNVLTATQVAFCVLVLFVAGLFVGTFDRLSNQPNGFSAERVLILDTVAQPAQPPVFWDHVVEHLRSLSGVEAVALSQWPLLGGTSWNGFVSVNGAPPTEGITYFLSVSPGWADTMKIPFLEGRDFRSSDTYPGVAIINEAFRKQHFGGENPIGNAFEVVGETTRTRVQVVGLVGDARYRTLRDPMTPTAYFPFRYVDAKGVARPEDEATLVVRTSRSDPLALAPTLRQEVSRVRPEFRVRNIRTQTEINETHTLRERLLAMLASFFAVVALLLAAVGLYGVLHYSVVQRRREIGIRIALGAQGIDVARQMTKGMFSMVLAGTGVGVVVGLATVRSFETLFYQVRATDLAMLALPCFIILVLTLLAALPPVLRAAQTDPTTILRAE